MNIVQEEGVGLLFDAYVNSNGIWNVGAYYRTGPIESMATHASFALTNPGEMADGHEFNVILYNADSNGDGTLDNNDSGGVDEDRSDITAADIIALGVHVIDGTETPNGLITVEFETPVTLAANGIYLLMIESSGFQFNSFQPPYYSTAGGASIVDYASVVEFVRKDAATGRIRLILSMQMGFEEVE